MGEASACGPRTENQDALRVVTPAPALAASKGHLLAIADGVSQCADGGLAARSSLQALALDYYATPETWAIVQSLDRLLLAQNRWLQANGGGQPLLTTLTALVLRGTRYTLAHVGDCRAYLWRDGELLRQTSDHVWEQPHMQHVLTRALGLDQHLVVDYLEGDLEPGSQWLLVSDGVWATLGDSGIRSILRNAEEPQRSAEALVRAAHLAGSQDNASALLVRVEALKTLPAARADDPLATQALLLEEWFLRRVQGRHFPELHGLAQRQHLYYLMREHPGETLAERLRNHGPLSLPEWLGLANQLLRGLGQLHRRNLLHRDLKPENLHLGRDGELRLLDFGLAWCPGLSREDPHLLPGTPSYLAPECFSGTSPSVRQDLYATGVCLYQALTGRYPYGEIEAFQHPRFGRPVPPSRYRPDLPAWIDDLLLRAVACDPAQRFETAEEWLLSLQQGEALPAAAPRPLLEREPLQTWRAIALLSLAANLALLLVWLKG
ncbi:bifunctional protein-serine/threonine kinase/phosphatase [Pseudomonas aeruginosa]|nr:bifunctional protein-serine/threonine kinase/phosphatase [Pseudomonas aeruginosa]